MSDSNKPMVIREEIEIVITPQAQRVLSQTKYSIDDFKEWALNSNKISLGGANVMNFLEFKAAQVKEE